MSLFKIIKSLAGRRDDTSGDFAGAEVSALDAAFSTNGHGAMHEQASSDHPYLQGRYEFERFFGDLARRRRTWQVVAIMALIVNLVLVVGYVELARRQKVVPYVVELDALGEARSVGKLALDEVPECAVIAALRRFIHNTRTIPTDARLLNARLNEARAFAMGQAQTAFMQAVRDESQGYRLHLVAPQQSSRTRRVTEAFLSHGQLFLSAPHLLSREHRGGELTDRTREHLVETVSLLVQLRRAIGHWWTFLVGQAMLRVCQVPARLQTLL